MKICSQCNVENDAAYRYCRECGHSLAAQPNLPDAARSTAATVVEPSDTGAGGAGKRTMAYRTEAVPRRAFLHRITSAGGREEAIQLESTVTTIGREAGDVRFPADVFLSNPHARLYFEDGALHAEDLGSANGTFVRVRGVVPLGFGDTIVIGHQALRLDPPADVFGEDGDTAEGDPTRLQTAAYGRPAAEYVGCLSALLADGRVGSRYLLDSQDWVLGRERGDIVFARDAYVSNDHLVVRYNNGVYEAEDLGSENGTYLRVAEPVELADGDSIMLGRQVFVVRFE
jgi:pSer/pThr/pTyr-binding forkhead associated (FHA) protein